jgi:hypothetical protein
MISAGNISDTIEVLSRAMLSLRMMERRKDRDWSDEMPARHGNVLARFRSREILGPC